MISPSNFVLFIENFLSVYSSGVMTIATFLYDFQTHNALFIVAKNSNDIYISRGRVMVEKGHVSVCSFYCLPLDENCI